MIRIFVVAISICMLVSTVSSAASIQLPSTGQTVCYNTSGAIIACTGTGQDGDKLKGVVIPSVRFNDNGNGTVTDNLTGLVWLKNADCFDVQSWAAAMASANNLANGNCGLSDGSITGQWRLPNRVELINLMDRSKYNPALSTGHPFTNVPTDAFAYWSSSTQAEDTNAAWTVAVYAGNTAGSSKNGSGHIWPVRARQ